MIKKDDVNFILVNNRTKKPIEAEGVVYHLDTVLNDINAFFNQEPCEIFPLELEWELIPVSKLQNKIKGA
tara:strand:+ start:194 stop:403 length:210 start_codon:yes stop_codon:yes gene_type:complete